MHRSPKDFKVINLEIDPEEGSLITFVEIEILELIKLIRVFQ